jgi:hypothetical protein
MADAATGPNRWHTRTVRWLIGLAVVAAFAWGGVAAWRHFEDGRGGADADLPPLPPDPRETTDSPYRNVRADVRYVGTAACAGCHQAITTRYAGHPMGRSLGAAEGGPDEDLRAEAMNPFTAQGFEYAVEKKGKQTIHHEIKKVKDGTVIYDLARPVSHVVGSGTRGKSYLWEREGRLFETPISWFSSSGSWGLSPGYQQLNQHFERPIPAECLFCHANQVEPVKHTLNRYQPPLFRGHAIGCERCHGPGGLHVKRDARPAGEPFDPTIVNPAKLSPHLRDAVCEQCHLQGEQRVARLGRSIFDYRPGLPVEDFLVHFVRIEPLIDYSRSVGQVEQMHVSQCYVKSSGKLGCVSCHDPHETPAPDRKVEFFRDRCQRCHEPGGRDCALPLAKRNASEPANDCARCHMPRAGSSSIAHASVTDHRVLRRPTAGTADRRRPLALDEVPLRPFHDSPARPLEARRETGLALGRLAVTHNQWPLARLALPLLNEAVEKYPQDTGALEGLVNAHWMLSEPAEAREHLAQLLRHAPRSEAALSLAARVSLTDRTAEAQGYCEQLLAINPHSSEYHLCLGLAHQTRKQWPQAIRALEEALRLNPARLDARRGLIHSLVQVKDWERAEREVRTYAALDPPDLATVRGWLKR